MYFPMGKRCQGTANCLSRAFIILLFMGISQVLAPTALSAQRQVSLAECRAAALEQYALVDQMNLVESAAEAQKAMLRRLITPEAGGFAMASYQSDVPSLSAAGDFGIDFSPLGRDMYRTGVYARQRLYDGGEYRNRNALTATDRQIGAAQVERQQRMLENGVDDLFLNTILIGKALEILHAREEICSPATTSWRPFTARAGCTGWNCWKWRQPLRKSVPGRKPCWQTVKRPETCSLP